MEAAAVAELDDAAADSFLSGLGVTTRSNDQVEQQLLNNVGDTAHCAQAAGEQFTLPLASS